MRFGKRGNLNACLEVQQITAAFQTDTNIRQAFMRFAIDRQDFEANGWESEKGKWLTTSDPRVLIHGGPRVQNLLSKKPRLWAAIEISEEKTFEAVLKLGWRALSTHAEYENFQTEAQERIGDYVTTC